MNSKLVFSEFYVTSHHGWKGEQNILYKCVETSPYRCVLKP